jgi:hypothetical protein
MYTRKPVNPLSNIKIPAAPSGPEQVVKDQKDLRSNHYNVQDTKPIVMKETVIRIINAVREL